MSGSAHRDSLARDAKVIGVVGLAHGASHFFQLALPPLFPLLRAEFGVSYALLGALVGAFYVASGLTQFAAGFAVDRLGARPVLFGGLALVACGALVASLAPGVGWLFPIAVAMGVGNGVFHPADFAILNANVAPRRLGHAYSSHGIGGNVGYVMAPIVSFGLGDAFGWRFALAAMGGVGLAILAIVASQRALLVSHRADGSHPHTLRGSVGLFTQRPVLLCFAYFVVQTMAAIGLQTFAPTILHVGLGFPLMLATSALTAYLFGGMAGILTGGFLAARSTRHDVVAAAGLATGALLLLPVAMALVSAAMVLPVFASVGFALGATGPSRDLIARGATPRGATGRVYGFVYSGLDVGGTLGPMLFGFMLDHGYGSGVLYAVASCLLLAVATVVRVGRAGPRGDAAAHQRA